jgi:hypothetical protein
MWPGDWQIIEATKVGCSLSVFSILLSAVGHNGVGYDHEKPRISTRKQVDAYALTQFRTHPIFHTLSFTPYLSHPIFHTLSFTPYLSHPIFHTLSFRKQCRLQTGQPQSQWHCP